jgi:hypothetical protein
MHKGKKCVLNAPVKPIKMEKKKPSKGYSSPKKKG